VSGAACDVSWTQYTAAQQQQQQQQHQPRLNATARLSLLHSNNRQISKIPLFHGNITEDCLHIFFWGGAL